MRSKNNPTTSLETFEGYNRFSEADKNSDRSRKMMLYGTLLAITFLMGVTVAMYVMKTPDAPTFSAQSGPTEVETLNRVVANSLGQLNGSQSQTDGAEETPDVTMAQSLDLISPAPADLAAIERMRPPTKTPHASYESDQGTSDLPEEFETVALAPVQVAPPVQLPLSAPQSVNTAATPEQDAPVAVQPSEQTTDQAALDIARLKAAVLAGDYTVDVREANGGLKLLLRPTDFDIGKADIEKLLQSALERGDIQIPEGATIVDGTLDLDTKLFNLVQSSLISDGSREGVKAAREMTQRALSASNSRASVPTE